MIGSNHSNGSGVLFLKALGVAGLLFSWLPALRPQMEVYWGRGANRPLMSQRTRVAFAIAATGWCLGIFGVDYRLALSLFTFGWVAAVAFGRQDEDKHGARTGAPLRKPPNPGDLWMGLCAMDAVLIWITSYALIRDHFRPPVTDEQRSVHRIGMVLLIALMFGAIGLYWTRRGRASP